jgi:hypothetical protein
MSFWECYEKGKNNQKKEERDQEIGKWKAKGLNKCRKKKEKGNKTSL